MRTNISLPTLTPNPFFDQFPEFDYCIYNPVSKEFYRLAEQRHWKKGSKTWKKRWNACMNAEYDRLIGSRTTDLETWQKLCGKLQIQGDLASIRKCKQAIATVHVNIVDLLDCWDANKCPPKFQNRKQLTDYTAHHGRILSKAIAKQDKVLRALLRRLV
ncbi:hypothetical protein N7468_006071 [Penicillium chermesinum]|uniref:Uncharacterized protein n=1 Tax=Penicillium chermesinum TaxID=63820 RepID=A0A9W9P118_9EURO|nr:uncharacterized protein N7468_006071 [Penicillium chermesinum]KAJ5233115.1 hypothetical protein N7468_006071 [Penicillium chermesinum]